MGAGGCRELAAPDGSSRGFGFFYDRFALANAIIARLYNGGVQQQYTITNPDLFPIVPSVTQLGTSASASSIWEISSQLRAPYLMQSAAAIERQLLANTTVAVTYAHSHGLHLLRSADLNSKGQRLRISVWIVCLHERQ